MVKTYKDFIEPSPNTIFVFGSNTEGRHGKGAALVAFYKFGAIYGKAEGRQGMAYAIITKDLRKQTHPSVSTLEILGQIAKLYNYASENPTLEFKIAYTEPSITLSGYTTDELAHMFAFVDHMPPNIYFEENFSLLVVKHLNNKTNEKTKDKVGV